MTRNKLEWAVVLFLVGGCRDEVGTPAPGDLVMVGDAGVTVAVTPEAGGTLTSSDGVTTIIVPPGAVAQPTELTIRVVVEEGDPTNVGYEFLPHGQQFAEPVTVRRVTRLDPDDAFAPLEPFIVRASGRFDVLPEVTGYFDVETDSYVREYMLTHFSLELSGQLLPPYPLGDSIDISIPEDEIETVTACIGGAPIEFDAELTVDASTDARATIHPAERYLWAELPIIHPETFSPDLLNVGIEGSAVAFVDDTEPPGDMQSVDLRTEPELVPGEVFTTPVPALLCVEEGSALVRVRLHGLLAGTLTGLPYVVELANGIPHNQRFTTRVTPTEEGEPYEVPIFRSVFSQGAFRVECEPCEVVGTSCDDWVVPTNEVDATLSEQQVAGLPEEAYTCASDEPTPLSDGLRVDAEGGTQAHFVAIASSRTQIAANLDLDLGGAPGERVDCGPHGDAWVVCADPASALDDGELIAMVSVMQAPVPTADPTNLYQYGWVFDHDDDPSNNYRAPAQFPADTFDNTDLWFQLLYNPDSGWTLEVIDARDGELSALPSRARVIIRDDHLVLLIPRDELDAIHPHRFTSFRHLGDFGMVPPFDFNIDAEPSVASGLMDADGEIVPPPPPVCIENQTVNMGLSGEPIPGDMRRFAAICPPQVQVGDQPECPSLQPGDCGVGGDPQVLFRLENGVYTVRAQSTWSITDATHGDVDPMDASPHRTNLPQDTGIELALDTPEGPTSVVFSLSGETATVVRYDPAYPTVGD